MQPVNPRRWWILTLIAFAQFMVVLDVTIVNVALPYIQQDLGFTASGLQWVVSAYTLLFGGFLLLGGRPADLLGRRRVFIAGLVLFGVTSLVAGLAHSPEHSIAMRAMQGLGGALLSPAAFAILTVTFPHGRERNIAMGVWGGLAGLGGTLGVIAGGVLVDSLSWRGSSWSTCRSRSPWPRSSRSSSPSQPPPRTRTFDVAGALLSTAGLLAIVLGVIRAEPLGWSPPRSSRCWPAGWRCWPPSSGWSPARRAAGAAAAVPLARPEHVDPGARAQRRGVPRHVLPHRDLPAAGARPTALQTGLQFLPMGITAIASAILASQLVTRFGTRPVQSGGLRSAAGLLLLSGAGVHDAYRLAEGALTQHRAHGGRGLRPGVADHGSLAGGEPRRLDHERLGMSGDVVPARRPGPGRSGSMPWGSWPRPSLPWRTPWRPRAAPPPRSDRTPRAPPLEAGRRARAPTGPRVRSP